MPLTIMRRLCWCPISPRGDLAQTDFWLLVATVATIRRCTGIPPLPLRLTTNTTGDWCSGFQVAPSGHFIRQSPCVMAPGATRASRHVSPWCLGICLPGTTVAPWLCSDFRHRPVHLPSRSGRSRVVETGHESASPTREPTADHSSPRAVGLEPKSALLLAPVFPGRQGSFLSPLLLRIPRSRHPIRLGSAHPR